MINYTDYLRYSENYIKGSLSALLNFSRIDNALVAQTIAMPDKISVLPDIYS